MDWLDKALNAALLAQVRRAVQVEDALQTHRYALGLASRGQQPRGARILQVEINQNGHLRATAN